MGDLLAFRLNPDKARRRVVHADGASAEILFFTGVRYERHSDFVKSMPEQRPFGGSGSGASSRARPRKRPA
ncbi:MAG: hypothetical protein JO366_18610 [Methylobacteriaceae bacterium]|nr:hypothetical protein [Methylobacteriaceae bacterium]MBV9220706.1 hypothetical protein [Methylobacteriaceae bacterium]MBV9246816.1 hypothetical protein [Methylobacteriaceae bacterium]MBV9635258.1 hypothetical protein [Methylobacteriaceae bacterium]MBV9702662.1 hypothetical protein [Methylobacteriaceae bacterium]